MSGGNFPKSNVLVKFPCPNRVHNFPIYPNFPNNPRNRKTEKCPNLLEFNKFGRSSFSQNLPSAGFEANLYFADFAELNNLGFSFVSKPSPSKEFSAKFSRTETAREIDSLLA